MSTGTFDCTSFANTVAYIANGNLTLQYTAYWSLQINGTGTKTLTVAGLLMPALKLSGGATTLATVTAVSGAISGDGNFTSGKVDSVPAGAQSYYTSLTKMQLRIKMIKEVLISLPSPLVAKITMQPNWRTIRTHEAVLTKLLPLAYTTAVAEIDKMEHDVRKDWHDSLDRCRDGAYQSSIDDEKKEIVAGTWKP